MNKEFLELYKNWQYSFCFDSTGRYSMINEKLIELEFWCKKNKDEALLSIKELLENKPSQIIIILPELLGFKPKWLNTPVAKYMSLNMMCNWWLNYLNKTNNIDYYKEYKKWCEHLDKTYLPWRPNIEDDPNVTFEEFKNGKRNNSLFKHKWHKFPLNILKDDELEKLYNEGHLGEMTKFIEEFRFFYNLVEEEIKRRKLKKNK